MSKIDVHDLGDTCIACANHLQRPFWHFEKNAHYYLFNPLDAPSLAKMAAVAKRAIYGLFHLGGLLVTAPLAIVAFPLKGLAHHFRNKEFTYWKGKGVEVLSPFSHKVLHLNTCMFPGSLPFTFGGMRGATERLDQLEELVRKADPDFFFLCESSATLSSKLYQLFADSYAHFLVNIGPSACGMDASMTVISRIPLLHAQFFSSNISAEKEQKLSYRGYFLVETETLCYLYVHLHPKDTKRSQEIRSEQLDEIADILRTHTNEKPFVLLGDFNIDRGTENHKKMLDVMGLADPLYEKYGKMATAKGGGSVDGIFTVKEEGLDVKISILETYEKNPLPLSDHKGIMATLSLSQKV